MNEYQDDNVEDNIYLKVGVCFIVSKNGKNCICVFVVVVVV